MYYLQKQGVYSHGVFWIGESFEQAIIEADLHASGDDDSYHSWDVIEYSYTSNCDVNIKVVYSAEKGK